MAPPVEEVFYFIQDPDDDSQPETGWYFWDIDGNETYGPYESELAAIDGRQTYLLVIHAEDE